MMVWLKMHASISFRPLEPSDFRLLQEWLAGPHVAVWWKERTIDLASVEAKYGPRVDGTEPTHVLWLSRKAGPLVGFSGTSGLTILDHAQQ
jgi:hypothetical protein